MPIKTKRRSLGWLWLLLLPLPSMVGYAESGDPLRTMTEISNKAAKSDRLPITHPPEAAWISCGPTRMSRGDLRVCPSLATAN